MSNTGKFFDKTPFIRDAGTTTATEGVTSDHSLRQDLYFRPGTETPEHIKKYRKSFREEAGKRQIHYGRFSDSKEYETIVHGIKSRHSEHVTDCIKGQNFSGVNHFINNINEEKYARSQREPLGESIRRNYILPEKIKDEQFRFGIPTICNFNAKDVLYSGTNLAEPQEVKTIYNRTHGLTDPGEQKNRNYNWHLDTNNHIFGKTQPLEFDGAKKSLEFDNLESQFPRTKIVNKRLEDFRQATSDMVGRSTFKGTLHPSIDDSYTFGVKHNLGANWNVAKCIHGYPDSFTDKFLQSDVDLGKTVTHRSKLQNIQPKFADQDKIFGVPSIRFDLKRNTQSVTDLTNYGNEKDAFELLYPNTHSVRGVDDTDFNILYEKNNLREVLVNNNYQFKEEEYNLIFALALKNSPEDEKVSLKLFIEVMRNLKREYMKYRTLIST